MSIKNQSFIGTALTLVLTSSLAFAQSNSKSAQTKLASENLQILSQVPLSSHGQNNATAPSTSTFGGMTVAQTPTPSSPTQPSSSTPSTPTPDTITPSSPTQPSSSTPSTPTPDTITPSSPTQPGSSSTPSTPTQPGTGTSSPK